MATSEEGGFEFTATGKFNGSPGAEFRVCGEDNGTPGKGNSEHPPDRFFLECIAGCSYDTASRTPDDGIDGGNIHLHDPIVTANADGGSGGGSSGDTGVQVIELDPILATGTQLGQSLILTARVEGVAGTPVEGLGLMLRSVHEDGTPGAVAGVTDALGVAVFAVTPLPGETAYWIEMSDLESNRVVLTGGL